MSGQIRDLTVGRTATDIASSLAIPGSAKALLPHIERRLSVEQRDGKPVVVVLDQSGKLSAATLDEMKAEFANDTAFAPLIAGITVRSESLPIRFKAATTNNGACTLNDGNGAVALVGGAHSALQGGEIVATGDAWALWHPSVGGGSYVLLFCTGGAEQVAPAIQPLQAVNAGQIQIQIQIQIQSLIAFTSTGTGTAPAFILTPAPAITAYAQNQRFRIKFHAVSAGAGTINISGLGVKNLKQYDSTGNKVVVTVAAGQLTDIEYDGVDVVILDPLFNTNAFLMTGAQTMAGPLTVTGGIPSIPFNKEFVSSQRVMVAGGGITLAHGLSTEPKLIQAYVICTTAGDGYAVGDKAMLYTQSYDGNNASANYGSNFRFDSINLYIRFGVAGVAILFNSGSSAIVGFANVAANFRLVVRAWA